MSEANRSEACSNPPRPESSDQSQQRYRLLRIHIIVEALPILALLRGRRTDILVTLLKVEILRRVIDGSV